MYRLWINALQYLSIFLMWGFAAGVLIFVPWLVIVAARWNDALNWSLAISLVMTPVYLTVAGTLTYVWLGVRHGAPPPDRDAPGPEVAPAAGAGGGAEPS